MKVKVIIFVIFIFSSACVSASENVPACYTFKYESEQSSATELRKIAAACPLTPVANLFYNRAYHIDLIKQHSNKSELLHIASDQSERFARILEAYRVYIALVEAFSLRSHADAKQLIAAMNLGYEEAMELAELRFQGYDRRADWLEWYRTLPAELRNN